MGEGLLESGYDDMIDDAHRSLDTAAADLAARLGRPKDLVRGLLDLEVIALQQSARIKQLIMIFAIKHVKECYDELMRNG